MALKAGSIDFVYPATGATLQVGQTYTVTWQWVDGTTEAQKKDWGNVKGYLKVYDVRGEAYIGSTITGIVMSDLSYSWTIDSATFTTAYTLQFELYQKTDNELLATSDEFSVHQPYLTFAVTDTPIEDEVVQHGTDDYAITWTIDESAFEADDVVDIYIVTDTGSGQIKTLLTGEDGVLAHDETYAWDVPDTFYTGDSYVQIEYQTGEGEVLAFKGHDFTVSGAELDISTDLDGVTWYEGVTYAIDWTSSGFDAGANVVVQFVDASDDSLIIDPAATVPVADGTTDITVPLNQGAVSAVKIKIYSTDASPVLYAESDEFSIAVKDIDITAPVRGTVWYRGKTRAINWELTGWAETEQVKVEIIDHVNTPEHVEYTVNANVDIEDLTVNWAIPSNCAVGLYKVRITQPHDGSTNVYNSDAFQVTDTFLDFGQLKSYTLLVSIANNQVWYENVTVSPRTMVQVVDHNSNAAAVNPDPYIAVIPAFQKVFIADGQPRNAGTLAGFFKLDLVNLRMAATITSGTGYREPVKGDTLSQLQQAGTIKHYGLSGAWNTTNKTFTVAGEDFTASPAVIAGDKLYFGGSFYTVDTGGVAATVLTCTTAPADDPTGTYSVGATGTAQTAQAVFDEKYTDPTTSAVYWLMYQIGSVDFVTYQAITGGGEGTDNDVLFAAADITSIGNPPSWLSWYITETDTYGDLPESASIGCLYRGRIVLAGNKNAPHQWYMSRQGDPMDWKYGASDAQSAIAGSEGDAGLVGDIITALIPCHDDYLILGCAHSIYIMRGDPAAGGSLDVLTSTDGVFSPQAWCFDASNNLYYAGVGGVYKLTLPEGPIENLTATTLPNFMSGIGRETHSVIMAYDRKRHGILISIVCIEDGDDYGTGSAWWYDIATGGFFPEEYLGGQMPFSMLDYAAQDADYEQMLLGFHDGYIRYFDNSNESDTSLDDLDIAIESHVLYPPVQIAPDDERGRLNTICVTTGGGDADTDSVCLSVYIADTAQDILDAVSDGDTAFANFVLVGEGRSQVLRVRGRGAYAGLMLRSAATDSSWSVESITGEVVPAGRIK